MSFQFKEIPGWLFVVDEISAGVYKVNCTNKFGYSIEKTGTDPDLLLEECKKQAISYIDKNDHKKY